MKPTKKKSIIKTINFLILKHIEYFGELPSLEMSDQRLQYHVNKLKNDGMIVKTEYGKWILTGKNDIMSYLMSYLNVSKK